MGTTFVSISGQAFWIGDGLLELWLRPLALHVEDPIESCAVAATIRDRWLLASRGRFNGCVPEGLEEAVLTNEGAAVVRVAIDSLVKALADASSALGKDAFN